jgi:hypothetical protein
LVLSYFSLPQAFFTPLNNFKVQALAYATQQLHSQVFTFIVPISTTLLNALTFLFPFFLDPLLTSYRFHPSQLYIATLLEIFNAPILSPIFLIPIVLLLVSLKLLFLVSLFLATAFSRFLALF